MADTFRQLSELLLGSVPTIVLFLVLVAAYRILVHQPLEKILAERRTRTEGALERARADIGAAEARTTEYERKLRAAQAAVFQAQEARRQQNLRKRAAAVAQARSEADALVKQNKAELAQEMARSKVSLQADSERLAAQILDSLLRPAAPAPYPAGGGK
jgi:F-type H+-transporting ATPase subunit b